VHQGTLTALKLLCEWGSKAFVLVDRSTGEFLGVNRIRRVKREAAYFRGNTAVMSHSVFRKVFPPQKSSQINVEKAA